MMTEMRRCLLLLIGIASWPQFPDPAPFFPWDTQAPGQAGGAALLEAVCPGAVTAGSEIGCRTGCPDYTAFGNPKQTGMAWTLAGVTRGHFLAPASEDAALSMKGCEPHTENFGGTVLLTRRSGKWSMVWYKAGVETSTCHKTPLPDRRQILVCIALVGGQGIESAELYTEDLLHPADDANAAPEERFFETYDNTGTCGRNFEDDRKPQPLIRSQIVRVDFSAASGKPALTVIAIHGKRSMTPREVQACELAPESVLPSTRTYRIRFRFDGRHYQLAPASAAAARLFEWP